MRISITNSLYIAGAILLGSAIISQFKNADLISSSLMVVLSIGLIIWGYRKDKAKLDCVIKSKNSPRIILITIAVFLVIAALGFAVGKLIYLWSQV